MKISVIIPVYNAAKYISKTVKSVLDQTYKNIEIIVIDDGSTDDTRERIKEFIETRKIIYIKKNNGGPATARNLGIEKATGDYITFIDADDIWAKDKIEKSTAFLQKNNLDIVHTGRFFISEAEIKEWVNITDRSISHFIKENYIITSSVLIKSTIIKQHKFDENKKLFAVEDYDLWLRLSFLNYTFGYLDEKLVGYRLHPEQISSHKNLDNLIYLYWKNVKSTNIFWYKILLIYMYIKISIYKYKIKF